MMVSVEKFCGEPEEDEEEEQPPSPTKYHTHDKRRGQPALHACVEPQVVAQSYLTSHVGLTSTERPLLAGWQGR